MASVSCAIRAHPARRDMVRVLQERLGCDTVVWDRSNHGWDTGARAWQAHDPDADWHVVVEDDAVPCRDLLPGLEKALDGVPAESAVSLYLGETCGNPRINRAVAALESAATMGHWLQARRLIWGVAIALPVPVINDMLAWCRGTRIRYGKHVYDTRIARYFTSVAHWPAYYTWPSLVDHAPGPSLIGHADGRHAKRFLGVDVSALDIDWPSVPPIGR